MSVAAKAFEWFGLHKLVRRVVFEGTITNIEPLRVGAGRAAATFEPVDLVVVKITTADGKSIPYIPGSSLKGVFRSYVVKLMRSAELAVCGGVPGDTCLKGDEFEELEKHRASYESLVENIANALPKPICLACLMFGSPGLASHIRFYDSYPTDGYRLGYRTMVAIDRRTGTAKPRALFSVEYVEPGAKFSFRVEFVNLPNYAIGVVAESLLDMHMGLLKIGGLKTRGFGWVKIENLKVYGYDYRGGAELKDSIPALDPLDVDVKVVESSWLETLKNFANAWRGALQKLRKVSESGWRWSSCLA